MSLITQEIQEKESLRIKVNTETKSKVEKYCKWAGINDVGHFFSEAAEFVFSRDKDWQKFNNKD